MPSAEARRDYAMAAAAAAAVYAGTLWTQGFIRDDRWLIAGNNLLRQGLRAVPELLSTGYVEMVMGAQAPIQEYRPLLTLSYLFHFVTTGSAAWPMHALNIGLHALVCCLLLAVLRRRTGRAAALAGALIFAVLPVHTEAVSYITSRSELLVAAGCLGAWLLLERESRGWRMAAGTGLFCAALLSKEHAIVFPALLALSDRTFHGQAPWAVGRRKVHAWLALCAAAYLGLRWVLLSHPLHGGVPYFPRADFLVTLLTYSRFALTRYLWPGLSGMGLCADFTRPLIPDAAPGDWSAWLVLAAWVILSVSAARAVLRRQGWGFWVLGPALFLLPTCHLIFPLDTLGAERFLYIPSLGLAALLGEGFARAGARRPAAARLALAALVLWYGASTLRRNQVWKSEAAYYAAAVRCNPVSARSRCALGAVLIERGDIEAGAGHLLAAMSLAPLFAQPYYNLGRLAWDRGDLKRAEALASRAAELDPGTLDARVLLALCRERARRLEDAASLLEGVLAAQPWHTEALFNLARLELLRGRPARARTLFARFAKLAPDDPDAAAAAQIARAVP